MYTAIELGDGESPSLNIASQSKAKSWVNQLFSDFLQAVFLMVKAILLEAYHSPASQLRALTLLEWVIYLQLMGLVLSPIKEVIDTGCGRTTFKNESTLPKRNVRIHIATTGSPKGRNSYGDRNTILPAEVKSSLYGTGNSVRRGRVLVNFKSNFRSYSTERAMVESNVTSRLDGLKTRSIKFPNSTIDKNLHSLVYNTDLLTLAYHNIKSNPGNMTPGITPETLDGISFERIKELSDRLENESFQFSPGRRVDIPKTSGGTRPLTVASPMDKIVQEAMRIILEGIYEPLFQDSSHGFRPNRSCHTALRSISQSFMAATWVIEGDISKCFDSFNHNILMSLIEAKILDRRFTRLIWKSLRAGYMQFTHYQHNIVGTPQGSVISPILANIYLNELDKYVAILKAEFDRGTRAQRTQISRSLEYRIAKAKTEGNMKLLKELTTLRSTLPATDFRDPNYRRLTYVRYADDWVIGIRGTYQEAQTILDKISKFCSGLDLKVSETKTKITNINSSKALFLGTLISRSHHTKYFVNYRNVSQRGSLKLRLEVPIDRIKSKLTEAGFLKSGKSHPRFVWLHHNHDQIIHLYNAVFRGYINYYSFAHNYHRLVSILSLYLKQSCAKLLATKFNLGTMKKAYDKFGSQLESPNKIKFLKPSYKITLKFNVKANPIIASLYGSKSIASLESLKCSICGSDYRVEMHHVRAMKDLNPKLSYIDRLMVKANRKQIPLCRPCHMAKHKGIELSKV